jgi:hypothetical protein
MGVAAAGVTIPETPRPLVETTGNRCASPALDRFFDAYYRRRPVTATFTGVHEYDDRLPDWSEEGLAEAASEMRSLRRDMDAAGRVPDADVTRFPIDVDLALADGFLEIQIAEHEGSHFYRRNPALWTGESIFSIVSLVTRPFAPIDARLEAACARMAAIPGFLQSARDVLRDPPAEWCNKALRECDAAEILFGRGLPAWLPASDASSQRAAAASRVCAEARSAFREFGAWLRGRAAVEAGAQAGAEFLDLLLRRGHYCDAPAPDLLAAARTELEAARGALDARVRSLGAAGWPELSVRIAEDRPAAESYLTTFERTWTRFREVADAHDLVTWPDAPIRYVPIPAHTRESAPLLYYLNYRSPAPFDRLPVHDYGVTPVDGVDAGERERRLAAANQSAVTLNHVVHHGGIGHHVQNWFAARSSSRIGQVAAVDAASRIAMFCGGTLAEGWACYVCDLMEEIGALTPLEAAAQQHTRVRLLARAVVDLALHRGAMTLDEAASFYQARGLMPAPAAKAEAVKNSMFPGAAVMYWLGTKGLDDLRRAEQARQGAAFSLRRFHDTVLRAGAIPVPLIARLMAGDGLKGQGT